jgi:glycosyltransferase involved in cell wall biosynthesis
LSQLTFLVPGAIDSRTGGYEYDRRIIAGLRELGWTVSVRALDGSFPAPSATAREHAVRTFADIPDGAVVMIDGLALGALPAEAEHEARRLILVALVHHPLAEETGLDQEAADALAASERRALGAVRHVVVTSRATAASLTGYGVEAHRVTVVEPGTDSARLARGSQAESVQILCVATITPRKGHDVLLHALAANRRHRWRLTCAGSLERDPATANRVEALARELGLADRVDLHGEVEGAELDALYDRADLFVLPSLHEGYGMAVAEALARGLPVIATDTGGIPDMLRLGGIIVPCGDEQALADALGRLIGEPALRARVAEQARIARHRLPTWPDAAAGMAAALDRASMESSAATFSADWLAVREPADTAARSAALADDIGRALASADPIRALDLAAGTGANTRYLAERLPNRQEWSLLDRDPGLLAHVAPRMRASTSTAARCRVETRQADLRILNDASGAELFGGRTLVTASALLDLVSEEWLSALVWRCREQSAAVLFALSYDGRIECTPTEPLDGLVRDLVNRHQRSDKGFGPALGPRATDVAERMFRAAGYEMRRAPSDWILTPVMHELQRRLIGGWAAAATEMSPADSSPIDRWRANRLALIDDAQSALVVGHQDLAGWLR